MAETLAQRDPAAVAGVLQLAASSKTLSAEQLLVAAAAYHGAAHAPAATPPPLARKEGSPINFKLFPGGSVSKALANLFRPRDALLYALTGRPFDGKEAARIGFVNYSVPGAELRDNVLGLAREIAAKDPLATRATKEAYRHSLDMGWEAAMNYAFAKERELTLLQQGAWREEGIGDFLQKKFRPGLESHERAVERGGG